MSSYPLVKFVDSPAVAATVRLDLNDAAATAPRRVEADFDLGIPTLEGDPDAVGQSFGFRSPRFTVQVTGTKANALAFVSALSKEMLRPTNWLMFQLSSGTSPRWFKTYRTTYQPLSLEQVYGNTSTGGNAKAGYPDVWRVEVPLVAEAFAYGALETIPTYQVIQAPADLAGPPRFAMRIALPGNYALNSSLETNADGWYDHSSGVSSPTWARQTGWAYVGTTSMRQRGTTTSGALSFVGSIVLPDAVQPGYAVLPGETWTVSAQCNILAGPPAGSPGIWAEIFWFDAALASLGQVNGTTIGQTVTLGSQRVSVTATAPVGAAYMQAVFVMGATANATLLDFYTDDVQVFRATDAIKGDAPAPLRVSIKPAASSTAAGRATWLLGLSSGLSSMVSPVVDIGTGDGFTAGSGTGAGVADAAYFGGSYRLVTIGAGANFLQRLSGTFPIVPMGRYKILLRIEADTPSTTVKPYLFSLAYTTVTGVTYTRKVSLSVGDVTLGALTFQGWVDLGEFNLPIATVAPISAATSAGMTFSLGIGTADSTTGTVRIDAFKLIPVDGPTVTNCTSLTAVSRFEDVAFAGGNRAGVFDGDVEGQWQTNSGGLVAWMPATMGGYPVADPAAAQNILTVMAIDRGTATSFTQPITSLNAQAAVDISYYPRFLHVGDGT